MRSLHAENVVAKLGEPDGYVRLSGMLSRTETLEISPIDFFNI